MQQHKLNFIKHFFKHSELETLENQSFYKISKQMFIKILLILLHSCLKKGQAFSPKLWLDPKQDLDPELSEK